MKEDSFRQTEADLDQRRGTVGQGCSRWQTSSQGTSSPPCCPARACSASGSLGWARSRGLGTSAPSGSDRRSGPFHRKSCSGEAERPQRSKDDEEVKGLWKMSTSEVWLSPLGATEGEPLALGWS